MYVTDKERADAAVPALLFTTSTLYFLASKAAFVFDIDSSDAGFWYLKKAGLSGAQVAEHCTFRAPRFSIEGRFGKEHQQMCWTLL